MLLKIIFEKKSVFTHADQVTYTERSNVWHYHNNMTWWWRRMYRWSWSKDTRDTATNLLAGCAHHRPGDWRPRPPPKDTTAATRAPSAGNYVIVGVYETEAAVGSIGEPPVHTDDYVVLYIQHDNVIILQGLESKLKTIQNRNFRKIIFSFFKNWNRNRYGYFHNFMVKFFRV